MYSTRFPLNLPGLFSISVNIPLIALILYTGSTNTPVVLEISTTFSSIKDTVSWDEWFTVVSGFYFSSSFYYTIFTKVEKGNTVGSRFFKLYDYSKQNLFPLDLISINATINFSNSQFFLNIFTSETNKLNESKMQTFYISFWSRNGTSFLKLLRSQAGC